MEKKVEFEITPEEMAEVFANMDDDQQARFFSECERQFNKFTNGKFGCEIQVWELSKRMDEDATNFIYRIANFRKVKMFPASSHKWNELVDSYPQTD